MVGDCDDMVCQRVPEFDAGTEAFCWGRPPLWGCRGLHRAPLPDFTVPMRRHQTREPLHDAHERASVERVESPAVAEANRNSPGMLRSCGMDFAALRSVEQSRNQHGPACPKSGYIGGCLFLGSSHSCGRQGSKVDRRQLLSKAFETADPSRTNSAGRPLHPVAGE
jgi:hypothetical protein